MGLRHTSLLILLGATAMFATEADLNSSIARHRTGALVIRTSPGAKVSVELDSPVIALQARLDPDAGRGGASRAGA